MTYKARAILTLPERFDEKWIPEPNSGCWLWIGATNDSGYGVMNRGRRGEGLVLSTRASWELHRGAIPTGCGEPTCTVEDCDEPKHRACVLHECDTPQCVNPDHLFIGTQRINVADCMAKGRHDQSGLRFGHADGAAHPSWVRDDATVLNVRAWRALGGSIRYCARQAGVSTGTVSTILSTFSPPA